MSLFRCARVLPVLALLSASAAPASDCTAAFSSCREDCSMRYGSHVSEEMKQNHQACMVKCEDKSMACVGLARDDARIAEDAQKAMTPVEKRTRRNAAPEVKAPLPAEGAEASAGATPPGEPEVLVIGDTSPTAAPPAPVEPVKKKNKKTAKKPVKSKN